MKQISSEKLLCGHRELNWVLCGNLEKWNGVGGRFRRKGIYVYLRLIRVAVWQKPTQLCKTKLSSIKKKKKDSISCNQSLWDLLRLEGLASVATLTSAEVPTVAHKALCPPLHQSPPPMLCRLTGLLATPPACWAWSCQRVFAPAVCLPGTISLQKSLLFPQFL